MPLYEYRCKKCKKNFEVLQKINAEPMTNCLYCQGDVEKLVSKSSFQFKGSGWYMTDYKKKSVDVNTSTGGTQNASTNK
ncbi:MAG: zinc ribbon domain-containing protein [Candidatus Aminicenantes bacterium]|nr:zinc ribbon domain-containing protein [Candidatus Aminicenantes bacterium]